MQDAVKLYRTELDRRLEEMNEFRAQILTERKEFLPIKDYDEKHEFLRTRVELLEQSKSNLDGKIWMLGAVLTGITVLLNFVFRYWPR